jgi:cysteine desulfurase/selenocysteine lyase
MNEKEKWLQNQFPVINNHKDLIYLDTAASSQKPQQVIDRINKYNSYEHSNIHRGLYDLSMEATKAYDRVRQQVKYLIGAKRDEEIVITKGTTDSFNLLAYGYGLPNLQKGDEVVISQAEHHSNILPWQQICRLTGAKLRYLPVDDNGRIEEEAIERIISRDTRIVSITMVSNALGTIQPVRRVIKRAHQVGAVIALDGAQSVPHSKVNVHSLDVDFLAFSSHKMFGPTGVGILYGKYELLEKMIPYQTGGDMIEYVEEQSATFAPIPTRFEAGTPNIEGVVGFGEAITFIDQVGISYISKYEKSLTEYAYNALNEIPYLTIYGPEDLSMRGPVISFNIKDIHPHDVTTVLSSDHVAIRAGHHCAQPLMKRLGLPSTCRASFGIYNTREDVDRLVDSIKKVRQWLGYDD